MFVSLCSSTTSNGTCSSSSTKCLFPSIPLALHSSLPWYSTSSTCLSARRWKRQWSLSIPFFQMYRFCNPHPCSRPVVGRLRRIDPGVYELGRNPAQCFKHQWYIVGQSELNSPHKFITTLALNVHMPIRLSLSAKMATYSSLLSSLRI